MNAREELDGQLWDLIYDLLPEDEARHLLDRIRSEPDVARAYAEARLRIDRVAKAARYEHPPVPLVAAAEPESPAFDELSAVRESAFPAAAQDTRAPHEVRRRDPTRWLHWVTGLAALLLLVLNGLAFRAERSDSTADSVDAMGYSLEGGRDAEPDTMTSVDFITTIVAPARLTARQKQFVSVATTTPEGTPRSVSLNYRWFADGGQTLFEDQVTTDQRGEARIPTLVAGANFGRLVIEPSDRRGSPPVEAQFEVVPAPLVTHLTTDRPVYEPNAHVRFRSVTLSRASLNVDREVAVRYVIKKPDGEPLDGTELLVETRHGVGDGQFQLPAQAPTGEYVLTASSDTQEFDAQNRRFQVRRIGEPHLLLSLEWDKTRYAPGESAGALVKVRQMTGEPVREASVSVQGLTGAERFFEEALSTDDEGKARLTLELPANLQGDDAQIVLTAKRGDLVTSATRRVPVSGSSFDLRFLAEAGRFLPHVANRVYLLARDARNKPVQVAGEVLDTTTGVATDFETKYQGMGVVSLTPTSASAYEVRVQRPAAARFAAELPPIDQVDALTFRAESAVIPPGEPLAAVLLSPAQQRRVVLSANCRGTIVGQLLVEVPASPDGVRVELPLPDEAAGVIQITAHDASRVPAEPMAERLVYRHPKQTLLATIQDKPEMFAAGRQVTLTLQVRDEVGNPAPAVLGASVVDENLVMQEEEPSNSMLANFLFSSHLGALPPRPPAIAGKPLDDTTTPVLDDVDRYFADSPAAFEGLELALGTHGWRRISVQDSPPTAARMPESGIAQRIEPFQAGIQIVENRKEHLAEYALLPADRFAASADTAAAPAAQPALVESPRPPPDKLGPSASAAKWTPRRAGFVTLLTGSALLAAGLGLLFVGGTHRLRGAAPALVVGLVAIGSGIASSEILLSTRPAARIAAVTSSARAPETAPETAPDMPPPDMAEPEAQSELLRLDKSVEGERKLREGTDTLLRQEDVKQDQPTFAPAAASDPAPMRGAAPKEATPPNSRSRAPSSELRLPAAAKGMGGMRGAPITSAAEPAAPGGFPDRNRSVAQAGRPNQALEERQPSDRENSRIVLREFLKRNSGTASDMDAAVPLWAPLLIADADGQAQLSFELDGSARTYRLRADLHLGGRLGALDETLIAQTSLYADFALPSLLTQGDELELPVVVRNTSSEPVRARLAWQLPASVAPLAALPNELPVEANADAYVTVPLRVEQAEPNNSLTVLADASQAASGKVAEFRVRSQRQNHYLLAEGRLPIDQQSNFDLPANWESSKDSVRLQLIPEPEQTVPRKSLARGQRLGIVVNDEKAVEVKLPDPSLQVQELPVEPRLLKQGQNRLQFENLEPTADLSQSVRYAITGSKPPESAAPPVDLETIVRFDTASVPRGKIVKLTVELHNRSGQELSRVVTILRIPAGLEAQFETWEELRNKSLIASYEWRPGEIVIAWPSVAAGRTGEQALKLEAPFLATVSGKFFAPASSTLIYLGDTRHELFAAPLSVVVRNP